MTHRVRVVVDGFNLYHSILLAIDTIKRANASNSSLSATAVPLSVQMKWLDLRALCEAYLPHLREALDGRPLLTLEELYYFSAFASHRGASTVAKHEDLITALTLRGVRVHLARFKQKSVRCAKCSREYSVHTEKETDVAVGSMIIELAAMRSCETIMVVSGDTDLLPAIRTARKLNPLVRVVVAFPYGRSSTSLAQAAHQSFEFDTKKYRRWQLPEEIELPNGMMLARPFGW